MPPRQFDEFFDRMRRKGRHVEVLVDMAPNDRAHEGRRATQLRVTDHNGDLVGFEALSDLYDCARAAGVLSKNLVV